MKNRLLRFLLGICYICLVAALLIVHIQDIAGGFHRVLAFVETLALAVFAGVILFLYIKMRDRLGMLEKKEASKEEIPTPVLRSEEQFAARMQPYALSEREVEVAWLLYRGYTNRQIGEELFIAETTVKKHVTHIYEKMQITGRKEFKEKVKNS